MNLNHMICPSCGHDFYTDAAYATCDACQRFFYASQSKTVSRTKTASARTLTVPGGTVEKTYPPFGSAFVDLR